MVRPDQLIVAAPRSGFTFFPWGSEALRMIAWRYTSYSQYYAQARYLCYYLQERRLLVKFYHEFAANSTRDPTGYKTLKRVLGEDDMQAFKRKWEKYVLALRSP
jgi:hypothetical protein